jgi:serine phosphatase RsbU (regulator of sigma subunit)
VYLNGTGELLKDLDQDRSFTQTIPKVAVVKTVVTMPLLREDKVYGILQLVNRNDGENFTEGDFRFAEIIVDQASLAIYNTFLLREREKKLETDADLKAAQEIQFSLIPKKIPRDDRLDIAKFFSPTRHIGGDYYDFIPIDENNLGVIIADVSGKGVSGGLVMSVMRTLMRMISKESLSPKQVLTELNHGVEIAVKEKHMFITVLYCIFQKDKKTVRVCRAGHNPFMVCKKSTGQIQFFKPEGIALGIIDSETFGRLTKEIEIPYESGDSMFLYTDGIVEEFNDDKEMYGEERLQNYLQDHFNNSSESIVQGLVQDLMEFRGYDRDQHDDIAMINVKIR